MFLRHWLSIFILACLGHFFLDAMLGIWPVYKSLAQLNLAKAGLIVGCSALIGEGAQLIFGPLSDRGYRHSLILLGVVLAASNAFLTHFIRYDLLFGLYLATCLGSGSFHPCAASLVSELKPTHRGLLMGIFIAVGAVGMATSQLFFTYTYNLWGHTAYLALPLLLVVALMTMSKSPQKLSVTPQAGLQHFKCFFKNPTLRALYGVQLASQSILWGTIFILPDVLHTLGYPDWIAYGGGHMCFILGGACLMIPGGYLADRYSPRQIIVLASAGAFIFFYGLLLTGGGSNYLILPILFLLGACIGIINPIALAFGARLEPHRTGAVSAFLMGCVWCLSEFFGPGGVGVLTTLFETGAPVKALAILGSFFLLQIYASLQLPLTVPSESSQPSESYLA